MKMIPGLLLLCLCLQTTGWSQELISATHISRQPYTKYDVRMPSKDTITFYLSEFDKEKSLPLVIYVQGSTNQSLFTKNSGGAIVPRFGHITFADKIAQKAKVLIVEKPGVAFLDPEQQNNPQFDKLFSLESWSNRIIEAISYITRNEKIDMSRIMIAGHSEGGVVAARVASLMKEKITHVSILAGEGLSQLYSLFRLAEDGVFFGDGKKDAAQRKDSLLRIWKEICADPESTTKKFWGFAYKRWSSFLKTSVYDELSFYNGKILIMQGDADKNVHPESATAMYAGLLSKNKNVQLEKIPGADHSFHKSEQPQVNGWENAITQCISWFLNP
jgi:predicted esterase